jgi:uncharacterized protein YndB with AHSA1/START domain
VRASATTYIACPPEKAFDLLADARHETEWNSRVSKAELIGAEPIGAGSKFVIVNGGTSYDTTIASYERPRRLVFEATGNPDVTVAYTLRPSGEGTELTGELEFRATGASKALFALLAPVIRRDVRKQYASFKSFCER